MKTLLVLICLFTLFVGNCQYVVADITTKETIAFPVIFIINKDSAFYADDKGYFKLPREFNKDSLKIACLGYEPFLGKVDRLHDTIFLKSEYQKLEEVVVSSKLKSKTIGFTKKGSLYWFINAKIQLGVLLIPEKAYINALIKKVSIPVSNKRFGEHRKPFNSIFKIVLYKNNNGIPGTPILKNPLIVNFNEKASEFVSINILEPDIYIPKEGLFIVTEMIGQLNENGGIADLINPLPAFNLSYKTPKGISACKQLFKTVVSNKWKEVDNKLLPSDRKYCLNFSLDVVVSDKDF